MPDKKISRRTFLKVTTVAGTGMLVGCSFQSNPLVSSPDVKSEELGLFVRISKDNNITIISPTSEIGQGTHTAHAMIIAEEPSDIGGQSNAFRGDEMISSSK